MNSKILVSILVPVYNAEQYIEDCLNSIICQTYSNLEIIVINDGSTDLSLSICERYLDDKRIRLVSRENRGLSATRQEGIDLSTGKYFCTLDADDKYDIYFVELMLKSIVENQADICVCSRIDFSDGNSKEVILPNKKNIYHITKQDIETHFSDLCADLMLSDSWNKLYRTSFVRNNNVRFYLDKQYNGNDLAFNHLLALYCPTYCVVDKCLIKHRYVINSMVNSKKFNLHQGFHTIAIKTLSVAKSLGYSKNFENQYLEIIMLLLVRSLNRIISSSDHIIEYYKNVRVFHKENKLFYSQILAIPQYKKLSKIWIISYLTNTAILKSNVFASLLLYIIKRINSLWFSLFSFMKNIHSL